MIVKFKVPTGRFLELERFPATGADARFVRKCFCSFHLRGTILVVEIPYVLRPFRLSILALRRLLYSLRRIVLRFNNSA